MSEFITKDSGQRQQFESGMVRDVQEGKPRYDLIPRRMLRRFAELLGRGAEKYGERNWEQARSQTEVERFKASAFRHLMQWLDDEVDEDHASAVVFNVWAAEETKAKLDRSINTPQQPHERTAAQIMLTPQIVTHDTRQLSDRGSL